MRNNFIIFSFLISIIVFSFVNAGYAQDTADERFADFLFSKGEYYRAITEYYRMLYNSSDTVKKNNYLKNIAFCYFYGEDYDGFTTFFQNNRNAFLENHRIYSEMNLYQGKSFYQLHSYKNAISILEKTKLEFGDPLYYEKYFFIALSYAHLYDWESANKNLELLNKGKKFFRIQNYLDKQSDYLASVSQRNPTIAGILSGVLPGAGYIYCDRTLTGISSLLVNGLLFWAILDAVKNQQYGLSVSISFFGLGWYVGNIIGSVNAANQYNSFSQGQYLKNYFPKSYK